MFREGNALDHRADEFLFVERIGIEQNRVVRPWIVRHVLPSSMQQAYIATSVKLAPLMKLLDDLVIAFNDRVRSGSEFLDVSSGNSHAEANLQDVAVSLRRDLCQSPHQWPFPILHYLLLCDD